MTHAPRTIGLERRCQRRPRHRGGVSLLEVVLVLAVIGVLVSMSVPSFSRTIEQSHADIAGANLRAVWTAQRLFWLENRTYSASLSDLQALDLVDPSVVAGSQRYTYSIRAASDTSFTAIARRRGSGRWFGRFTINESGVIGGVVRAAGERDIVPGYQ